MSITVTVTERRSPPTPVKWQQRSTRHWSTWRPRILRVDTHSQTTLRILTMRCIAKSHQRQLRWQCSWALRCSPNPSNSWIPKIAVVYSVFPARCWRSLACSGRGSMRLRHSSPCIEPRGSAVGTNLNGPRVCTHLAQQVLVPFLYAYVNISIIYVNIPNVYI